MDQKDVELIPQYEYNFETFFKSIDSIKALAILGVIKGIF